VAFKFGLTAVVLGLATATVTLRWAAPDRVDALEGLLVGATAVKLAGELAFFRHLRDAQHSERKRSARLMRGPLGAVTWLRFAAGGVGGLVLPLVLVSGVRAGLAPLLTVAIVVLVLAGEMLERRLFFSAVASGRMPGTLP
jgi:DMSO reductase anchor subunit